MSIMPRQPEPELMDLPHEAEAYAQANFGEVNGLFVERLVQLAGDTPRAEVVDLGCGPADIPIRIAAARPNWRITAVDAAEAMLVHAAQAIAQAGCDDRVRIVRADAKHSALPSASFDIVISNSLLHHLGDPERLWAEIARLGRPGALVVLRDLARPRSHEAARRLVDQHAAEESELLREEFYRSLLAAYTPDEIRDQLHRAGLGQLTVEMVSDRHLDVYGRLTA